VQDLYIIVLNIPCSEVIEISSSSCDLSIFSLKADSPCDQGVGVVPRGGGGGVIECEHRGVVARYR
jgi:hypothetical protein